MPLTTQAFTRPSETPVAYDQTVKLLSGQLLAALACSPSKRRAAIDSFILELSAVRDALPPDTPDE